jgi:hypothetical protein
MRVQAMVIFQPMATMLIWIKLSGLAGGRGDPEAALTARDRNFVWREATSQFSNSRSPAPDRYRLPTDGLSR